MNYIFHPDTNKHELLRAEEPALEKLIETNMSRHIAAVPLFCAATFEPEKKFAQRMDVIGSNSSPLPAVFIQDIAARAFPKVFEVYVEAFKRAEQTLHTTLETLTKSQDVWVGTTHQRTDDIAIVMAAMLVALMEYDSIQPEDMHSELWISKFITGLGADIDGTQADVSDLLAGLGNVRYTLPPSQAVTNSGIPDEIRRIYNQPIREEALVETGVLRFVAISGTTIRRRGRYFGRQPRVEPGHYAAPVSKATIQTIGAKAFLPIAAHVTGKKPDITIHPLQEGLNQETSARLMEDMTTMTGEPHFAVPNREQYQSLFPASTKLAPKYWNIGKELS